MPHCPRHHCSKCCRFFTSKQCLDRHDLKIHPPTIEVEKADFEKERKKGDIFGNDGQSENSDSSSNDGNENESEKNESDEDHSVKESNNESDDDDANSNKESEKSEEEEEPNDNK